MLKGLKVCLFNVIYQDYHLRVYLHSIRLFVHTIIDLLVSFYHAYGLTGCGSHAVLVMAGVPPEDRCVCRKVLKTCS